jgi:Protein of unknown function (DUF1592)/Protein of unknown function (DUF1588)/Protein of unknown function (DUF1585)/Protein of unknown function (DUF1587)/Protein of unknown function (DUF1595)
VTGVGLSALRCEDPTAAPSIGPTVIHRLSRLEYHNSVRDLFGIEVNQGDLPSDELAGAFIANTRTRINGDTFTRYDAAAKKVASALVADFSTLSGCADFAPSCVEPFLVERARRAFHGVLESADQEALLALYRDVAADDQQVAAATAVRYILTSPRFLFPIEFGTAEGGVAKLSAGELAGRLADFLWRSVPDAALLAAADNNELASAEGLKAQALRMLDDARAEPVLQAFVTQWLGLLDAAPGAPALDQAISQESQDLFVDAVMSGNGTYTDLITSKEGPGTAELASFYGTSLGADGQMTLPAERQGLLLRAAFLRSHISGTRASTVKRGKAVRVGLLCDEVPPPDPVSMMLSDDASLSDQEVFNQHSAAPECWLCHKLMDPMGDAFADFDAAGRYDANLADKTSGIVYSGFRTVIEEAPFEDTAGLVSFLANNETAQQCFALQATRFALTRGESLADGCGLTDIWTAFKVSNFNLKTLLVEIATSSLMQARDVVKPGMNCR